MRILKLRATPSFTAWCHTCVAAATRTEALTSSAVSGRVADGPQIPLIRWPLQQLWQLGDVRGDGPN
jgi:hypothetical protein